MLQRLLPFIGTAVPLPPGGVPLLTAVNVGQANAGRCLGGIGGDTETDASLRVAWTVTSPYDGQFWNVEVSGFGATQTVPISNGSVIVPLYGWVESGPENRQSLNIVFTVKVIAKNSGRVVSTMNSATWTKVYGKCSGGGPGDPV